ncbi:MAG: lysophospholipase [Candidatus Obscuribacterales bacterium]|nr:lysophospholipase [Candidatus Obscuribacterales bacterium]
MRMLETMEPPKERLSRNRRSSLSHLGRRFINKTYKALTGQALVPKFLTVRAVANGLKKEQFSGAIRLARGLNRLPDYLQAVCDKQWEKAQYWDDLGLKAKAADYYLDSALWGVYADLITADEEKAHFLREQYRESYFRAAQGFRTPTERVELTYLASTLQAYFRLPALTKPGQQNWNLPCVILFNDLFSSKEELHYVENSLLAQGLATFSIDYPGHQRPYASFDVKELGNAIYLFLYSRTEIDSSRLCLYGISLGGRFALHLNLLMPEKFKSVVCLSTPYDLHHDLEQLTKAVSAQFFVSPMTARTALHELAERTPIEDALSQQKSSILIAGGGKDNIVLPEETQHLFNQSASKDKQLVLCPGAGHGLYEMMPSLRYEIAQWITQRI